MLSPTLLLLSAAAQAHDSAARVPDAIADHLRSNGRPALTAIASAAPTHPLILLGDVHPAAEPKQLLVRLIEELHGRGLLDAVALEVPMTQQPAIRRYLASDPEDVRIVLSHPLLLRPHWGMGEEYLEIYRTVWRLNHSARADRPIEILAIDAPRGPPMVASRREALARYVHRDAIMELRIRRWRAEHPGGRMLIFVGDLHTLRRVEANLELGDTFDRMIPLAERLGREWPDAVFSVLSDAAAPGHPDGVTRVFPTARRALGTEPEPLAIPIGPPLGLVSRPLHLAPEPEAPVVSILPGSYTLGRITDLYLYFGRSSPLTPIAPP